MEDMIWLQFLAWSATFTTIILFLTSLPLVVKFYQFKHVDGVESFPFQGQFNNCIMWTLYGYFTHNRTVFIVNFLGSVLAIFYIISFMIYCSDSTTKLKITMFCLSSLTIATLLAYFCHHSATAIPWLGFLASFCSVLMFASPLASIRSVILTKSSKTMHFRLIVMCSVVSWIWFFCFQFWIFWKYRSSPGEVTESEDLL
eukprot:Sdes_comp20789_c1_seq3m16961